MKLNNYPLELIIIQISSFCLQYMYRWTYYYKGG